MLRIDELELAEVFYTLHPFLLHLRNVVVGVVECAEHLLVSCLVGGIFLFKVFEDIPYPESVARHLVGVGRSDTFTCGTYFILTFSCLVSRIEDAMSRHDEVGFLGDVEP